MTYYIEDNKKIVERNKTALLDYIDFNPAYPPRIRLEHKPDPKKYIRFQESSEIRTIINWINGEILITHIPTKIIEEADKNDDYTLTIEYYKK